MSGAHVGFREEQVRQRRRPAFQRSDVGHEIRIGHDILGDGRVPDLQMLIRDKHWLSDVYVINPMAPSYRQQAAQRQLSAAGLGEYRKEHKYHGTALAHGATFVPFVVESAGGLGQGAVQIIEEIVLASRDNNTLVHHRIVSQQLRAAIGINVSFYSDVVQIHQLYRYGSMLTSCL